MNELPENPTLSDLQKHIESFVKEKGFNKNSTSEKFLLLNEEIGELAKAIRNNGGLTHKEVKEGARENLEEEFADVLNYILDLANDFQVDLEKAYRTKASINRERF